MKVTFVDHSAVPGGGELALVRTIRAMRAHTPWVEPSAVLFESGDLVALLEAEGVPVAVLPFGRANDLRRDRVADPVALAAIGAAVVGQIGGLARLLARTGPDVVHTNSMKAHVVGGIAARLARRPVVWHLRDRLADDYLPGVAVRGMRGLARVVPSVVVANSAATASTLPASVRCVVVPSPVALPEEAVPEPSGPFTVGCVGRLAAWKGQHVLVEAFAAAFPRGDERLVLVGDALFGEEAYRAELVAQIDRLGLADRVRLVGHVDDVGAELARMHVVVHCSTVPEPFGQVVVEAMAAGRAVVAANAGGPAEVVEDGVTGVLTSPGDAGELAGALRSLAGDAARRSALGAAARAAVAPYGPRPVAFALGEVYRTLA